MLRFPHPIARNARTSGLAGILLVALAVASPAQEPIKTIAPGKGAPRGEVLEWTSTAGRPYRYRLPETIRAKSPPALILMLHGTGLDHRWSFANYPVASGAFRGDDVIVSPDGLTPGGKTFNFVQGPKDGAQIVELIKTFREAFPIDRVYLYGHSQGAFFCYWFAGAHPELVDGIIAHAGNVLDVAHPKLAREKVAIAILHARSDPVVPVSCAIRTEAIYRKAGYAKLKLVIVENIRKQAGHWPLPKHVAELLEWLDVVSVASPSLLLDGAERELAKASPDIALADDATRRAGELLARYRGADAAALGGRRATIATFLDALAAAQATRVLDARATEKDRGVQPWMIHFRRVARALGERDAWQKATRTLASKAKGHVRSATKALARFRRKPSAKAAKKALDAVVKYPLATESSDLLAEVKRFHAAGAGEADARSLAKLTDQIAVVDEALEAAEKEGASRAAAIDDEHLTKLRAAHPDRFGQPQKR